MCEPAPRISAGPTDARPRAARSCARRVPSRAGRRRRRAYTPAECPSTVHRFPTPAPNPAPVAQSRWTSWRPSRGVPGGAGGTFLQIPLAGKCEKLRERVAEHELVEKRRGFAQARVATRARERRDLIVAYALVHLPAESLAVDIGAVATPLPELSARDLGRRR